MFGDLDFEGQGFFIIHFRQCVQLFLPWPISGKRIEIFRLLCQGRYVEIQWVQGKSGYGRIRIGVNPGSGGHGIVDGQDLDHLQSGFLAPIHQERYVGKLPDPEALFAFQAENGYCRARASPGVGRKVGKPIVDDR